VVNGVYCLCIISHVVHYRHGAAIHAYAPYAREIEIWADLFPEVRIAAPCEDAAPPGPPGDTAPIARANVRMVPQPRTGGDTLGAKLKQLALLPALAASLAGPMRRADAVHVRCPGNLGLLGVLLAPLFSRRRIAKYAGQWTDYAGEALTVRLQKTLLRSRWWGAPVTVYGAWPDQPSHIVPFFTSVLDGQQVERARRAASSRTASPVPRVLFVGRLSRSKNVHVLMAALGRLRQEGIDLPCTVVGDGPERAALEAQAGELGVAASFAGGVELHQVLAFYETHDLLVLASETEGWPKAIAEAMAFGLVCVGSERGLIPQMLGEGRGWIVPPGDETTLADALRRVAGDPQDSRERGRRAAVWGQRYSLEGLRDELRELMERWWQVSLSPREGDSGGPGEGAGG
jgi:glycosyltransferase involved in cell wall biosynthesis